MLPQRPEGKYDHTKQHDPEWQKYVWHLGRWNMLQLKDVAALLGIPLATLKNGNHEITLGVYRTGMAEAFGTVNFELMALATADPYSFDDPVERSQVRLQKMDALKTLSKIYEKRGELEALSAEKDQDRDMLKSLSTEELRAKAMELLK